MIYNNLIYFLVVIFLLSTDTAPEAPRIHPAFGFITTIILYLVFAVIADRTFRQARGRGAAGYFSAEKKLSILAILLFACLLYFVDVKYYLHPLSLGGRMPVLENIGALFFFYLFLVLMWLLGRSYYMAIFQRFYSSLTFIVSNTRANLPIILPWLLLSFLFDLLAWLNLPGTKQLMDSSLGDLVLFLVLIFFLVLFFPPLVRWLWRCKALPPSPLRSQIEAFFRRENFSAQILVWPLYEGQVITAGIMGLVPGLRYLLITPALLETMNRAELEAVLAHEIGHAKKKHLILYILLFLGFSILAGSLFEPLPYLYLGSDWFYDLASLLDQSPENLLPALITIPFLILLVVYFRYLFGYFIRNFERQADLHVFDVQGHSNALINSFEKIALLSGNIRDQKSWHHFGIGERITFLERCEADRSLRRRHDIKVYASLIVYFICIGLTVFALSGIDKERLIEGYQAKYLEAVMNKLDREPQNALLYLVLGNLLLEKKMEHKAIDAYERALILQPDQAELYNNFAWLLLTADDPTLHDPGRALPLARKAFSLEKKGYILDTLAVALWANGRRKEAIAAEEQAMQLDPDNQSYYTQQARKMARHDWTEIYGAGSPQVRNPAR